MQANWLTKTAIIYTFFTLSLFTSVLSTFVLQAVNYYHVSNASAGALESYQNITQIFLSFVAFSVLLNLGYKRAMIIMLSLMTLLCLAMPFFKLLLDFKGLSGISWFCFSVFKNRGVFFGWIGHQFTEKSCVFCGNY